MSETPVPSAAPGASRPRAGRRRLPGWIVPLGAIASLLLLLVVLFAAYEVIYRDRVIQGVTVQQQPIQGLTRDQAGQFLQRQFGQPDAILARFGGEPLVLRDGDQSWRAYPWELGLRTEFGPVAEVAIRLGHQGSILEMLADQARCGLLGCELGTAAQFDVQTAQAYLGWLAPQVDRPARDASLRIGGLSVVATPAEDGREIDGATMLERIQQRIISRDRSDIPIAFRDVRPLLSDVAAAKALAETILAAPVTLTFNGRAWAIDPAALAAMISIQTVPDADGKLGLTVGLDHQRLVAFLTPLARDINQPARDARFHFDPASGALTTLVPSQYGQELDPEATAKQIESQVQTMASRVPGLARPLESSNVRTIGLPVTVTKPTIAMEDAPKFGIKELVAQGTSNFKGSAAGRIQNIQTATEQFEGIVIPPGGDFSFDQNLGDVVEANGYDDAYVIFADRTVLGPGGGVCQVSTTLFRAAFWGGYPIVERWAHAYAVRYYEPPVGLDATVFSPVVDFKFKNDGDTYLLIQTDVNLKTATLTFNLYGTKPNRAVEMEDPVVENVVPHGPAIYTNDPSLKKGVVKQVDFAYDGEDVTVYRKILVNGQLVKRDRFFSRYQPWVARYQVGTKP